MMDLPYRKSLRLSHYDYSNTGAYFITICAHRNICIFGLIENESIELNELGDITQHCWKSIPEHFTNVNFDEFTIMPNHMHGIINISDANASTPVGARHAVPATGDEPTDNRQEHFQNPQPGTTPSIVRSFKSAVTKQSRIASPDPDFRVWQRGYNEHVIRNQESLQKIREYIKYNHQKWREDKYYAE